VFFPNPFSDKSLVVVPVAVPPGPILFLFPRRQMAEIAVGIAVVFARPLVVVDDFVVIPDVIVAIVGVIDPVIMRMAASRYTQYRRRQGSGQKTDT
jgi:hypothetical protein